MEFVVVALNQIFNKKYLSLYDLAIYTRHSEERSDVGISFSEISKRLPRLVPSLAMTQREKANKIKQKI